MASLREIKDRIGSVKSTLKITSAMKFVASSKLRKAQKAVENLRPYEQELNKILAELDYVRNDENEHIESRIAIITISSNSSLCGAFNGNVIKKTLEVVKALEEQGTDVTVYSLGRRAADAMKKAGYPTADYSQFIAHPSYAMATEIAGEIKEKFDHVLLVYNHFVTTAKQEVVVETWISEKKDIAKDIKEEEETYIIEPGRAQVLETLIPQVTMLKFYAAVLDSAAAEQAARTIAMQTASDNAQELLSDLTLEYNKGRQQKITAEILDLIGGNSE